VVFLPSHRGSLPNALAKLEGVQTETVSYSGKAMSAKSIAVIGGGIGGVSAALNLLRAGFDVHVYEQSRALREVGAGINVTPNAARVIHGLGLGDKLASLGVHQVGGVGAVKNRK
jgi:2-polyprenyl-6-methoxyphenol hydroxylase-like FAD-dependent oxidoreductase